LFIISPPGVHRPERSSTFQGAESASGRSRTGVGGAAMPRRGAPGHDDVTPL
jgi:hypothetical protein